MKALMYFGFSISNNTVLIRRMESWTTLLWKTQNCCSYVELEPGCYRSGICEVSGSYPSDYNGYIISNSRWLLDE